MSGTKASWPIDATVLDGVDGVLVWHGHLLVLPRSGYSRREVADALASIGDHNRGGSGWPAAFPVEMRCIDIRRRSSVDGPFRSRLSDAEKMVMEDRGPYAPGRPAIEDAGDIRPVNETARRVLGVKKRRQA